MNTKKKYIGRYAPSPSGTLHLGNVAALLLAWLDIRSVGGSVIFRMEDLDPDRSSYKFAMQIADDLKFLGLDWDTGWTAAINDKYAQSSRTELYDDAFNLLKSKDLIYPCYCSRSQRLAASAPHLNENSNDCGCKCRYLSKTERASIEASGKKPSWKVKVPDREIVFTDAHYGVQRENLYDSGDFIIKRSDGVFAYQLAVSFDDMDMGINRVVRGRDLLSSTARQIWLISELGGTPAEYCHTPLFVSEDMRKMSKRFGSLSMAELKRQYSANEILGFVGRKLDLCSCKSISADELLRVFDWELIPKNDIIINEVLV